MSRATQDTTRYNIFLHVRDFHSLWLTFPDYSISICKSYRGPTTPLLPKQKRFGLFPFRSPLLWESLIVFSSSRYLDVSVPWVCSLTSDWSSTSRVAPFGYLRITSYVPIPAAFRSLSRPSSPLRA